MIEALRGARELLPHPTAYRLQATGYSSCDSLEVQESSCHTLACRVLEVRGQSGESDEIGERGERGERAVFRLAFY